MRAGRLRSRIVIERPVEGGQNPSGEPQITWQEVARGWAAKETPSSRALAAAAQRWGDLRMVVRMRFVAGVGSGMRATLDGEQYLIADASDPDGYRRELMLVLRDLR